MCVHCKSEGISLPFNYQPYINADNCEKDKAKVIHRNCMTILHKDYLYCDSQGRLQGYHWINFPMRVWRLIKNWKTHGQVDRDVVQKVTDTFDFILNLNVGRYRIYPYREGKDVEDFGRHLSNTFFSLDEKFLANYTTLADRMIRKYSHKHYPVLFNLAHRILHERKHWIKKEVAERTEDGKLTFSHTKILNIRSHAIGTPYEKTTVWEEA
jgi:hypothetical protein